MTGLTCFKAYDTRGRLGIDLDEEIAYRIGPRSRKRWTPQKSS